jgi:hypothetical protein
MSVLSFSRVRLCYHSQEYHERFEFRNCNLRFYSTTCLSFFILLLSQALISVLKEHNHILGMLRIDLGTMSAFLQKVALDATETRSLVNNIKDELKIHVRDVIDTSPLPLPS